MNQERQGLAPGNVAPEPLGDAHEETQGTGCAAEGPAGDPGPPRWIHD